MITALLGRVDLVEALILFLSGVFVGLALGTLYYTRERL